MNTTKVLRLIGTAAIALSPALILSLRGGTGYCFFVVLALSLVHLCNKEHRRQAAQLYREHRLWVWAMLGLPCVVLFQIVVLRTGTFPALDPLLRLALVVPSFFFLSSLEPRQLGCVRWGFAGGALLTSAWTVYQLAHPEVAYGSARVGNSFTNPIPFGDTALLLGFLAFASSRRDGGTSWPAVIIRTIALLGGCYASYASGARGGWMALPFLVWAAVTGRHWFERARLPFLGFLLVCLVAVSGTSVVRDRIGDIVSDIHALRHGDSDTSMGVRLDLWRASTKLYLRHPIFGVGRGRLESAMRSLVERGEGPPMIINGRAHSEFFSVLAETGTVGVIALLGLYGGTFRPFWKERRSHDPQIATASYLGMMTVGATIIFGLTIDVLTLVMNAAFFALTAATLLAWIEARKREIVQAQSTAIATELPTRAAAVRAGAEQIEISSTVVIHGEKNLKTDT